MQVNEDSHIPDRIFPPPANKVSALNGFNSDPAFLSPDQACADHAFVGIDHDQVGLRSL